MVGSISALASANAPFIFFDDTPFLGQVGGVGQITLTATRHICRGPNNTALPDHVMIGHLRAPLSALRSLRQAIDQVEKMIQEENTLAQVPTPSGMAH